MKVTLLDPDSLASQEFPRVRDYFRFLRTRDFHRDGHSWHRIYRYATGQTLLAEVEYPDLPIVVLYDEALLEEAPELEVKFQALQRLRRLEARHTQQARLRNYPLMHFLTRQYDGLDD